jgi:hypothetical protein
MSVSPHGGVGCIGKGEGAFGVDWCLHGWVMEKKKKKKKTSLLL